MINLKNLLPNGMMTLNYLMDHILYQIFKIFFNIFKKAWRKHNPSIRIYINKLENRITFKIVTSCYLELVTLETVK